MESKQEQITFYGNHPKREVVAYLLPNGNFDVFCHKLLLASNVSTSRITLMKSFFEGSNDHTFTINTKKVL